MSGAKRLNGWFRGKADAFSADHRRHVSLVVSSFDDNGGLVDLTFTATGSSAGMIGRLSCEQAEEYAHAILAVVKARREHDAAKAAPEAVSA